jgi:hypothetical protein
MRFAYADPPYLGTSKFGAEHHYGDHHDQAGDYDSFDAHSNLIARLYVDFPDGWALSGNTTSMHLLLPEMPSGTRVCAWVKGWCSWKPGVHPKYAWEPVYLFGGRVPPPTYGRDWMQCNVRTAQNQAAKIPGAKPDEFCRWVLQLLGYTEGDEVVDLFPGTGVMDRVLSQGVLL